MSIIVIQFLLYSAYCTVSATVVCETKALLGYLVCNDANMSNVISFISIYMTVYRKLRRTHKIGMRVKLLWDTISNKTQGLQV